MIRFASLVDAVEQRGALWNRVDELSSQIFHLKGDQTLSDDVFDEKRLALNGEIQRLGREIETIDAWIKERPETPTLDQIRQDRLAETARLVAVTNATKAETARMANEIALIKARETDVRASTASMATEAQLVRAQADLERAKAGMVREETEADRERAHTHRLQAEAALVKAQTELERSKSEPLQEKVKAHADKMSENNDLLKTGLKSALRGLLGYIPVEQALTEVRQLLPTLVEFVRDQNTREKKS